MQFLWGLLTGAALMGLGWVFHAKILGYASAEVEALKARIKALGGRV